jgi:hypothetical protein
LIGIGLPSSFGKANNFGVYQKTEKEPVAKTFLIKKERKTFFSFLQSKEKKYRF